MIVQELKEKLPEYAKDTRLNLDAVFLRSSLTTDVALGCAYAAVITMGDADLIRFFRNALDASIQEPAHVAALTMAQNNVWYPYADSIRFVLSGDNNPRLRMNAIVTYASPAFEAYSLAASIVGKCHFCIEAHAKALVKENWTVEQIRDVGRVVATMNAVSKGLRFS